MIVSHKWTVFCYTSILLYKEFFVNLRCYISNVVFLMYWPFFGLVFHFVINKVWCLVYWLFFLLLYCNFFNCTIFFWLPDGLIIHTTSYHIQKLLIFLSLPLLLLFLDFLFDLVFHFVINKVCCLVCFFCYYIGSLLVVLFFSSNLVALLSIQKIIISNFCL